MKGLPKLFVRSILSPNIAPLYMGLSFLAVLPLIQHGHGLLGLSIFIVISGSLMLLHAGRMAVEAEDAKSQVSHAEKDIITK